MAIGPEGETLTAIFQNYSVLVLGIVKGKKNSRRSGKQRGTQRSIIPPPSYVARTGHANSLENMRSGCWALRQSSWRAAVDAQCHGAGESRIGEKMLRYLYTRGLACRPPDSHLITVAVTCAAAMHTFSRDLYTPPEMNWLERILLEHATRLISVMSPGAAPGPANYLSAGQQ